MPVEIKTLDFFFREFLTALPRDYRADGHAYTLILGAGASRSAGIPLASEMVSLLETIARLVKARPARQFRGESKLSWLFRTVLSRVPYDDEFADPEREFIRYCISRASREPNLTHLLALHFAVADVFGPIVTTNFDDLLLAAYWSLPAATSWVEPHLIYDPRSSARISPRIVAGVPVVVKAHGHHTSYGIGMIDKEIGALARDVKQTLKSLPPAERGFLVVGYSGAWNDGIMQTLKDPKFTRGKTIYWLFQGRQPPMNENIAAVARHSDIRFIRILDSDGFFLRMWHEIHSDEEHYNPPLMETFQLFSNPQGQLQFTRNSPTEKSQDWWGVREIRSLDTRTLRNHPRLIELRKELIPLLKRIEDWDNACLLFDCAPRSLKDRIKRMGHPISWIEPPELRQLSEAIPARIRWTRRNRKLLSLALGNHVDPMLPYELLPALDSMSR